MNRLPHIITLVCTLLLSACATQLKTDADTGQKKIALQNRLLSPGNGGNLVSSKDLQAGDIVLSSTVGLTSLGIRTLTLSPVSHAALYIKPDKIAEAVGSGVRERHVDEFMDDESTVVAFRHPAMTPEHARKIESFIQSNLGSKYNFMGIVLQAPFSIERRICELPLLPGMVRDFCMRGIAAIQLGVSNNDRFFCSQLVLEAYRAAGLPLTEADPRMISPDDLLHMREGDVPSVKIHQTLAYVGHLKIAPRLLLATPERKVDAGQAAN